MFGVNLFKNSQKEDTQQPGPSRDVTVKKQFNNPAAPEQQAVVAEQPGSPEQMQKLHLRGGGEGEDVCCGVCTGLLCFECCKDCC